MNRTQQIAAAVRVLAPALNTREDYAACRADVGEVLDIIGVLTANAEFPKRLRNKTTRRTLRAYQLTLRRAQLLAARLPPFLVPELSLEAQIAATAALLAAPAGPPRRSGAKQHLAAQLARALLAQWQVPIKKTRGSRWHRLAAILYGQPGADLFRHLRRPDPGQK